MAWRSSGTNNESMVNNLKRFGVVRTATVEEAFRKVDRRFFVPRNQISLAHADQPLREDHVHISAPHIYGTALEALELQPAQSFLNLGSGTGYLSCIVANMLGPRGVHVAVEVAAPTLQHAQESWARWQAANPTLQVPAISMLHGNALQISLDEGEAVTGFDRIYVGATVPRRKLHRLAKLLKPGGILVGPVDDDLVKVMRVGEGNEGSSMEEDAALPRTLRGHPPILSSDFSLQVLSGVRFASLVESPHLPIVLPSRIWEPATHGSYPDSFRRACHEILLCASADQIQQPVPLPKTTVNAAAILPRALWMEVFSYTTRDWFEQPCNTEDLLRRRLKEEQDALRAAQEARQRAEARVMMMERERDLYKLLLLRCQTRLRTALGDQAVPEEALLLADGVGDDDGDEEEEDDAPQFMVAGRQGGFLRALRLLRRTVAGNNHRDEEEESHEDVDLEESEDDTSETAMEAEAHDDDGAPMEEDTELFSAAVAVAARPQARTVSISGDDF